MSERIGVFVKDGEVVNSVVWADHTADQVANDGYDHVEEVTGLDPRPGIGWTWDESNGYRPPSPFASWSWDGVEWVAPVEEPGDGGPYEWNEETLSWDEIPTEEPLP